MIDKLSQGFDLCSGWRKNRKDSTFKRVLVSKIANKLISKISGVNLKDYGCTLKAYRKKIIKGVRLYGEMHRFIPIYVFGGAGFVSMLLSLGTFSYATWLKFVNGISYIQTPLPVLSAMTLLAAFMCILMGLLAEMIMRTYLTVALGGDGIIGC